MDTTGREFLVAPTMGIRLSTYQQQLRNQTINLQKDSHTQITLNLRQTLLQSLHCVTEITIESDERLCMYLTIHDRSQSRSYVDPFETVTFIKSNLHKIHLYFYFKARKILGLSSLVKYKLKVNFCVPIYLVCSL